MSQTNIRRGSFPVIAAEALAEDRLVKITNATGVAKAALPAAVTDDAFFVVANPAAAGANADIQPLEHGQRHRVTLKGTANPGDRLVLADPSTAADAGKVRVLPTAAGTYRVLALAAEIGVDGQSLLIAPVPVGNITVTE
jgi:hypothetical protein